MLTLLPVMTTVVFAAAVDFVVDLVVDAVVDLVVDAVVDFVVVVWVDLVLYWLVIQPSVVALNCM